jgi:hypothetical protein
VAARAASRSELLPGGDATVYAVGKALLHLVVAAAAIRWRDNFGMTYVVCSGMTIQTVEELMKGGRNEVGRFLVTVRAGVFLGTSRVDEQS